jgi:hypothetical protein
MVRSQLSQFDEMRINNGGTLTDREQGYQAYYAEELEFLQSDDSMDWLKKCMGVVLKHTDIEHYHKLDEKQVRPQCPAVHSGWVRVLTCPHSSSYYWCTSANYCAFAATKTAQEPDHREFD